MENEEMIDDMEVKLLELRILFHSIFDLVRYYEAETGQFSTIEYLCEIMEKQFEKLMEVY
jgi:hypothetical protein